MFGGIERNDQEFRFFVEIVRDRTADTLLEVIRRRIRPGTWIMSDEWKSYRWLDQNGYLHDTVNHSENFINPENPEVHTQTIESIWNSLKSKIKKKRVEILKFISRSTSSNIFIEKNSGKTSLNSLLLIYYHGHSQRHKMNIHQRQWTSMNVHYENGLNLNFHEQSYSFENVQFSTVHECDCSHEWHQKLKKLKKLTKLTKQNECLWMRMKRFEWSWTFADEWISSWSSWSSLAFENVHFMTLWMSMVVH